MSHWHRDYHVEDILDRFWEPEMVETRRDGAVRQAAMISRAVGCPECGVEPGHACLGLTEVATHYGRGAAYARTGGA